MKAHYHTYILYSIKLQLLVDFMCHYTIRHLGPTDLEVLILNKFSHRTCDRDMTTNTYNHECVLQLYMYEILRASLIRHTVNFGQAPCDHTRSPRRNTHLAVSTVIRRDNRPREDTCAACGSFGWCIRRSNIKIRMGFYKIKSPIKPKSMY